ncbi:MAG: UDP-N-acetylglucosamine--N-acetylmuramyl-(pentapeptide) pyrophosphoryl-undecaprenol N-acetylglucosamine transferase [Minisyncoccales bacterium]
MPQKKLKIVFTGGGTGGHIFPIISIVREIKRLKPKEEIIFYFIGPKDKFSGFYLPKEGIKVKFILSGKLRRYNNFFSFFQNIFDFLKIPLGFIQSFFLLLFIRPKLIFSKGGYGSIPVNLAGFVLRIPLFLHESDIVPGSANKFFFKMAIQIFNSFLITPSFPQEKTIVIGNPIRRELLLGSKREAIKEFLISQEKPVILILGGSQGAKRINEKIIQSLIFLLDEFEIIHQTGIQDYQRVKGMTEILLNSRQKKYYHLFPFLEEKLLAHAYAISDLIVSRAGSGSIFEIAAVKKPSILIPLPESANDHQLRNAYYYAAKGGAVVLEEKNFTPVFFAGKIKELFSQKENLEKMRKAAEDFSKPLAGKIIAAYFLEYFLK